MKHNFSKDRVRYVEYLEAKRRFEFGVPRYWYYCSCVIGTHQNMFSPSQNETMKTSFARSLHVTYYVRGCGRDRDRENKVYQKLYRFTTFQIPQIGTQSISVQQEIFLSFVSPLRVTMQITNEKQPRYPWQNKPQRNSAWKENSLRYLLALQHLPRLQSSN